LQKRYAYTFNVAATTPIALFALGVVMFQTAFKLNSTLLPLSRQNSFSFRHSSD
jgi:hypothetical protein